MVDKYNVSRLDQDLYAVQSQERTYKAQRFGLFKNEIGPVFTIPKLLKLCGLRVNDIDMWEINEVFASQCLYVQRKLEIDNDKLNKNGGSIVIGHPFVMTGSR